MTDNKLTVLITGGAGFLGHNLSRFLLNRDCTVHTIDLDPFDYPELKQHVKHHKGDIRNKDALRKAAKGCDVIVHTAAGLPLMKAAEIRSINMQGVKSVMEVASELGIPRVVHISTTAVYGIPDHHPLYEHDKMEGVGPYGESKVTAEKIADAYRRKLCVPILRPKSFIGAGRLGVFDVLFDWTRRGKNIPLVGWGNNLYQLLHVEDLNEAIWLSMTQPPEIANDTFNIGAEKFGTMKKDYQALLDYAGFGKRVIGTPPWLVINTLRVLEKMKLSPLYKWVYETADKDSFVSIEKAQKKLGWQPKYSNVDALIDSYDWYLQHYEEYLGKSGTSHRLPWKQGILALIRAFF